MNRWMVYPTRRIAGWCPAYFMSEKTARYQKAVYESVSGVKWNIKKVEE